MDFSLLQTIGGACFVTLIIVEIIFSLRYDRELYEWKDLAASSSLGIGSALIAIFTKAVTLGFFFLVYNFFNPEVNGVHTNILGYAAFGWGIGTWLICQILDDFSYYWFHRANHEIRFFWAAHIVHHSSDNFNLGTGVRNGWVTLFYKPLFYMWLPAIGFHPIMVMTCLVIESFWQFQLHTKFMPRLGWMEKFLNGHKHHHVHHSSNLEYLDKNHGGYLNLFDKLFGTFKDLDESHEIQFGVLHPPNSYNPIDILTHEYRDIWRDVKAAPTLKAKFMYIFGPPGWSHDGSRKTVREIQKEMEKKNIRSQYEMTEEVYAHEAEVVG
ncbi:MAG: sterol desaturase family protein [Saprospiraceae bacterium]|nr:sterol desaturase family protein [Saprospiraceae bacterium]